MPKSEHQPLAILITGKGDNVSLLEKATSGWPAKGVDTQIFPMGWNSDEDFLPKLNRLLELIDSLAKVRLVHVVGVSAGGSVALHSFLERPDTVHSATNLFGRLRAGQHKLRSLDRMSKGSPSFHQSVSSFEQILNKNKSRLSSIQRQKILTIRSAILDELVPSDTTVLEGARNEVLYLPEHLVCIYWSLKFSNVVLEHILKNSEG